MILFILMGEREDRYHRSTYPQIFPLIWGAKKKENLLLNNGRHGKKCTKKIL
jgi:hypothetical protein